MKKIIRKLILTASVFCGLSFMSCDNGLTDDIFVQPSDWSEGVIPTNYYLMSSIGTSKSQNSDALHLAVSTDGLNWTALNDFNAISMPDVGSGHIREPFIFRMNDGKFVMLAADYTNTGAYNDLGSINAKDYWAKNNRIVVAFSDDLINWSNGHYLQMSNVSGRQAWTPKALYNSKDKCYDIYWVGDTKDGHSVVYRTQTYDFYTVKDLDEHLVYDAGYSVTGAYAAKENGNWYMVSVDARDSLGSRVGFDVQLAKAEGSTWAKNLFKRCSDAYINRIDDQNRVRVVRNPCIYQIDDGRWIMLASKVNDIGKYQVLVAESLTSTWSDFSSDVKLFTNKTNALSEDASVTKITQAEYYNLLNYANQ